MRISAIVLFLLVFAQQSHAAIEFACTRLSNEGDALVYGQDDNLFGRIGKLGGTVHVAKKEIVGGANRPNRIEFGPASNDNWVTHHQNIRANSSRDDYSMSLPRGVHESRGGHHFTISLHFVNDNHKLDRMDYGCEVRRDGISDQRLEEFTNMEVEWYSECAIAESYRRYPQCWIGK